MALYGLRGKSREKPQRENHQKNSPDSTRFIPKFTEYQIEQLIKDLEDALDALDAIAKEADERDAQHEAVLKALT